MNLIGSFDNRVADLSLRVSSVGVEATTATGRVQVDPTTLVGNSINIVFIGQSTNNNGIIAGGPFSLVNKTKVYNGSIGHNGSVFRADDTNGLLSSDLITQHHAMDLGDALVTGGNASNVVLWNISFGGSNIANFCPGGGFTGTSTPMAGSLAYRIGLVARCMKNVGLDVNKTIIDLQHGEWDTDAAITQTNYTNAQTGIINEFKLWGILKTGNVMFIHLNTRITGLTASRNIVRAAQALGPDGVLVRAGVDIDTIVTNRPDGTHFDRGGAALQAALKKPLYTNFIANG